MSLCADSLLALLRPYRQCPRWWLACSGGVDSMVLLQLLADLAQRESLPALQVIHIDHQLHSQSAQWAQHCQRQCEQLGLGFHLRRVNLGDYAGGGVENAARQARYQVFEQLLAPGELLLLAHHLDDQIETFLQRLLRGSGAQGAAAMPAARALGAGSLLRPLLGFTRAEIVDYARARGVSWVDDPSNAQTDYDRNFLRLELLPLLATRWPGYRQTLARAAALSAEARDLNDELAALDWHALGLSPAQPSLPLAALAELSLARRKNLLRHWLAYRGFAAPSAAQLQALLDEVIAARTDAEPLLQWPGVELRRFAGELYAMAPLPACDSAARHRWHMAEPLYVPGMGRLSARRVRGAGLAVLDEVELRFRRGGERCKPQGRDRSQTLKKLLQEFAVPTWLRDRVPLIYSGEQLVAVADYWICEGWQAAADAPGMQLSWQPDAAN